MSSDVIAGRYRVVREIARSNDVVYEAIDGAMGRRIAVKELVIPPNLSDQARRERIERFNREARAAGKLSHPNIVTIYNFGEDGGRYYIAMEYLEGETLRDLLQARRPLPPDESVEIAGQVLAALGHAHAHRVVHRDVKPDNIHLLPGGQVKLTDFGIARLTEEASLTGDGQVFGTPSYMSPEQIEGRGIDLRTDLFSLGVVLYEMLAGHKPFTGDSVVSITYAIMNADPAPMAGVPLSLEQVVRRALAKRPAERYASADEMRREMRAAASVPSMFLPTAQPTGMGYFGAGASAPAAPPTHAPAPAPPQASPPPPAAVAPSAGPFVNWSAPSGSVAAPPAPPAFGRRPSPGISESGRTALVVLTWILVIAGGIVGFVLLFDRAYQQQIAHSASLAVGRAMEEGNRMVAGGDLQGAATRYAQVLRAAPGTGIAADARTNLATTLNRLGVRSYENRDFLAAEDRFSRVVALYQREADVRTEADLRELENARFNLARIYSRAGGTPDAPPGAGLPGMTGEAPDAGLAMRLDQAQRYLELGNQAWNAGDRNGARSYWVKAAEAGVGTAIGDQAQRALSRTATSPEF